MGQERSRFNVQLDSARQEVQNSVSKLEASQATLSSALADAAAAREQVRSLARFPEENPNPVLRILTDGTLQYANPAALEIAEWGLQTGAPAPAELLRLAREALAAGSEIEREIAIGERVYWLGLVPVSGERYVNVYARDATERRRAEESLQKAKVHLEQRVQERTAALQQAVNSLHEEMRQRRQAEQQTAAERQRLYDVLKKLPVYVILLSGDYRVPFANRFFEERFGRSEGRRCYEYLFNRTSPCENCETFKVLQTHAPHHWEWTGPDGRNYDIYDYPFTDSDGSYMIMEMGVDVTEVRSAQRELQELNQTLERRVAERTEELKRANRTLTALGHSGQAMMRAQSEQEYLDAVCRIVIEDCGVPMVWIGYAEDDERKTVRPVAWAGFEEGYIQALKLTWADEPCGRGPTGTAIRTGKVALCRDMQTDPKFLPWRQEALKRGYASSLVLPLTSEEKTFGALTIYSAKTNGFPEDDIRLLSDLGNDLAYGITTIRQRQARRQAEEALRESEQRVRRKLQSVLSPEGDLSTLELADLIDGPALQKMMQDCYALAGVPMAVIDLKGRVLVGVGWQDICTQFHRKNPESCKACIESDIQLSAGVAAGEFRLYKCKNNLWDVASPIHVGGQHVGNIFTGQFFLEDERIDREAFRAQARRFGFDEEQYLASLERVPRLSREKIDRGMGFLLKLADTLSRLGYSNVKVARSLAERDRLTQDLARAQAVGQVGSWRLDTRNNVLRWSAENHRIFGIPEGTALTYESFLATIHPDDRQHVDAHWQAALRGQPYEVEHRILVNGRVKWVREKAYLEFDPDGKLLGGFGITQDVTQRKADQDALSASEARFRLLSDTAGQLLTSADPQAMVESLCRNVMKHLDCHVFFNFLVDEQAGRLRLSASAGIPEDDRKKIEWLDYGQAVCGCVARDRARIVAEDIQNTPDERTELVKGYGVQAYCCHALMAGGRLLGTLSFGTKTRPKFSAAEVDLMRTVSSQVAVAMERLQAREHLQRVVTERTAELTRTVEALQMEVAARVEAEKGLQERSRQLRLLASELTLAEQRERQRLAQVLHDGLQQILVGARFRLELLGRTDSDVSKATEELDGLLLDAIQTSRNLTAELSPPILHEAGLMGGLEWLARWMQEKHGLTVNLEAPQDLADMPEDLTILLFQAARELLFNVVKHAQVRTAGVQVARDNGGVQVIVSDQGAGFDAGSLRGAGGRSQGFGLFSIRERMELLGGRLIIDSAPGRGSRFTLEATLGSTGVALSQRNRAAKAIAPRAAAMEDMDGKIRLVLVDDHIVMRQGLTALLREESDMAIIGEASDGRSAVELICRLRPDVVLMDINMPGMDGIEATRILHAELPQVRVIGLSMFDEADRARAMREAGAVNYLTKSGPSEALLAAIREAGRK